jgi:hypothetical protein
MCRDGDLSGLLKNFLQKSPRLCFLVGDYLPHFLPFFLLNMEKGNGL